MRILYVDIDSLRPDHLGCYGYGRPTSPVIDEIAAGGVRFTHYYAADTPCLPSRAACSTGRPGIQNGVVAHEDTPIGSAIRYSPADRNGRAPMLTHHLAAAGMQTVCFSSFANRHLAGWFHFGFREFYLTSLKNGNENADEVNAVALPWLRRHASEDNWFVHLNYWDPHTNYTAPAPSIEAMARHPAPAWPDAATIERQQSLTGIRTPRALWAQSLTQGRSPVPTMPDQIGERADFEQLINGYDGGIRFADEQLGLVFAELARQGVLDETAIVISADHGEAFGELGQYMEHGAATPAVHQVPFIVRWPGITDSAAGSTSDELLSNLDFAPTMAEALGLALPRGWAGRSFLSALRGEELPDPRSDLIWGHGLHTRQRAVFDGRFLFIRTYHPGAYGYPPRMLFDLAADPHLTTDLAPESADLVARYDTRLQTWEADQLATTGLTDPMRDVDPHPPVFLTTVEDHLDHLIAAGRDTDAQRLRTRLARLAEEYTPAAWAD